MMEIIQLWPIIGIPALRSIAGWLENSLEDGEVSTLEWQQLGATVLRVGTIGAATFFGLEGLGFDVSALGASASALVMDFILSAMKKSK